MQSMLKQALFPERSTILANLYVRRTSSRGHITRRLIHA
jgi:hypothetical protein